MHICAVGKPGKGYNALAGRTAGGPGMTLEDIEPERDTRCREELGGLM